MQPTYETNTDGRDETLRPHAVNWFQSVTYGDCNNVALTNSYGSRPAVNYVPILLCWRVRSCRE